METTGQFETSSEIINQTFKNAYWGIRGNYRGMPTDCPQRDERQGWLGDRATGCFGEAFIFDNALLYSKWVQDIEDSQSPEGSISVVSPRYWTIWHDDVTWPAAYFYAMKMLSHQYGDTAPINKHYPSMKRYLERIEQVSMQDYIVTKDRLWRLVHATRETGSYTFAGSGKEDRRSGAKHHHVLQPAGADG